MDISLITAASPAPARSNAPSGSGDSTGFARQLQQAVDQREPRPDSTPADTSTEQAAPISDAPRLAAAPDDAQAVTDSELPLAVPQIDTEPAPAMDLTPLLASQASLESPQQSASAPLSDAPLGRLEEIRRRLALIEQAGELPSDNPLAGLGAAQPMPVVQPLEQSDTMAAAAEQVDALSALPTRAEGLEPRTAQASQGIAVDTHPARETSNTTTTRAAGDSGAATVAASAEQPLPVADSPRNEPLPAALMAATTTTTAASSTSTPATPSVTLSAPLASREWQADLGQQLIGLHQRGDQQVELHLHPAELGPLSVSLKLNELGAHAQFLSAHPQVRAAVEQAIPQLREALASQGITLGEASVGEQHQPAADQQAQQQARRSPGGERAADLSVVASSREAPRTLLGQVDLYA